MPISPFVYLTTGVQAGADLVLHRLYRSAILVTPLANPPRFGVMMATP